MYLFVFVYETLGRTSSDPGRNRTDFSLLFFFYHRTALTDPTVG